MAPTTRPLDPALRAQLESLLEGGQSLRSLAAELGVNYFVVFKGTRGGKLRPSTERQIREGLERAFGGQVARAVGDLLRAMETELDAKRVRKFESWLRKAVVEAYRAEGHEAPRGLVKNSVKSSRRLAELQQTKRR